MKHTPNKILNTLFEDRILPLFYDDDLEVCKSVIKACYDGGARLFEFTHRGSNAQSNFVALRNWSKETMPELFLGIGTIKDENTAVFYINAGADFIVCPVVDEKVATTCSQYNILWIPGCMTPTEISRAEKAGAKLVKLFPGEILGPHYLKSILPLFPALSFMPTGGVTVDPENLEAWIAAGAKAVGMGSKLVSTEWIKNQEYSLISNAIQKVTRLMTTKQPA